MQQLPVRIEPECYRCPRRIHIASVQKDHEPAFYKVMAPYFFKLTQIMDFTGRTQKPDLHRFLLQCFVENLEIIKIGEGSIGQGIVCAARFTQYNSFRCRPDGKEPGKKSKYNSENNRIANNTGRKQPA